MVFDVARNLILLSDPKKIGGAMIFEASSCFFAGDLTRLGVILKGKIVVIH